MTADRPDRCSECRAPIELVGRRRVAYELVTPTDGGPDRVEHTDERCRFHQFLEPASPLFTTGPVTSKAEALTTRPAPARFERWGRVR